MDATSIIRGYVTYDRVKSKTRTHLSSFMSTLLPAVILTLISTAIRILIHGSNKRYVLSFTKLRSVAA